ncbi:MAG: hypothetical protein CMI75_07140 [Candidatus Pelagibacter sp.]|nr:hypothetical protein [Candidatus Pelagibacter sp.]
MVKFYIPFYYLFHTRLKTKMEIFSWQIIFIVPQFLITYFYLELRIDIFLQLFLLSQLIFHTLYEVGYIENDTITTKKEINPTLRLNKKSAKYVKNNFQKLIYFRYFIVILLLGLLNSINLSLKFELNVASFILVLLFNRLFFLFHNHLRSRLNILTFFILAVTKYIFPLVLFISNESILYPIILSVIAFPLLRSIEICTLKRHNFKNFVKIIVNLDKFRILYYLISLITCIIIWHFSYLSDQNISLAILIFIYFALFRAVSYFLIKKGIYKRDLKIKSQYPLK